MLVAFDMRRELLSVVVAIEEETHTVHETIRIIRQKIPASAAFMIVKPGCELNKTHPAFGKSSLEGRPTVYICRNTSCSNPLSDEDEIIQALKAL